MSGRNKLGGFWRYHSRRRRRAKSNSHDDYQMPKAKEKQEGLLLKKRFYSACLASPIMFCNSVDKQLTSAFIIPTAKK